MSTIQEHQQQLASVNSQNPDVMSAASTINQYTEMCKSGQLSKAEYVQLLQDMQSQMNIQQNMIEQNNLIMMNTAINGLINLASLA